MAFSTRLSTRSIGRPWTSGAEDTTGLAWLFVLLIVSGLVVGQCAAQSAQTDGSGLRKIAAAALSSNAPKRVQHGYVREASPLPLADGPSAAPTDGVVGAATGGATEALMALVPTLPSAGASPDLRAGQWARVANTDNLGVVLRTAPRKDARVPRGLLEGTRVVVLHRGGEEWAHVRAENGLEGRVPIRYLAPASQ